MPEAHQCSSWSPHLCRRQRLWLHTLAYTGCHADATLEQCPTCGNPPLASHQPQGHLRTCRSACTSSVRLGFSKRKRKSSSANLTTGLMWRRTRLPLTEGSRGSKSIGDSGVVSFNEASLLPWCCVASHPGPRSQGRAGAPCEEMASGPADYYCAKSYKLKVPQV